jgi:hypothetical protein
MTTLLSDSFKGDAQLQAKLQTLSQFMDDKSLPLDLKMRIRRHFRYIWTRSLTLDVAESEILRQLSTPLRRETLRHMFRVLIADNPLFRIIDSQAFRDNVRAPPPRRRAPPALSLAPPAHLPRLHAVARSLCAHRQRIAVRAVGRRMARR